MITAINLANSTSFNGNIRTAANKTLARVHYINFLKAEGQFFDATKMFEQQTSDLSLKTIGSFAKAVKNFGKMAYERIVSSYYYNKK